jgi:hypothetical protein
LEDRKCKLVNGCISDFYGKAVFSALRSVFSQPSRIIDRPRADNGEFHEEDILEKYKDKDISSFPAIQSMRLLDNTD